MSEKANESQELNLDDFIYAKISEDEKVFENVSLEIRNIEDRLGVKINELIGLVIYEDDEDGSLLALDEKKKRIYDITKTDISTLFEFNMLGFYKHAVLDDIDEPNFLDTPCNNFSMPKGINNLKNPDSFSTKIRSFFGLNKEKLPVHKKGK